MKKALSFLLLTVLLIFTASTPSFAADETATLYSYYGDNMLFKQNEAAVIAGKAKAGTEIICTLLNSKNDEIASAGTTALQDGTFSLSFTAPAGSFEEYTAVLTADGKVFDELNGIVFGELWLAGGQSNMQMSLISSKTGYQMALENKRGSDALRFFHIPYMGGSYNGNSAYYPATPLTDYECEVGWYKGSDVKVFELSAIGYYFAENLIKELNMPVGVLNANMGGTSIITWLSREAIENNAAVLADCKSDNRYIPLGSWNEKNVNFGIDMTCNFNKIMAPLKNFRLSGMLWYQGEGDIAWSFGRYSRAFDALQDLYTDHFSYNGGKLPIVFSQLASYSYGDLTALQNTNAEFAFIQQNRPDSRALTSISDVSLEYTAENHAIHPLCKKEVADKMTYAANGLVYNKHDSYTAATVKHSEALDGSIYITFRDVGDRLISDGDTLYGFSICDNDGIYVSAKAEIVADNIVRVYSNSIKEPVSVAYAYSQTNLHANLFASRDGQKLLAVSPFVTNMSYNTHHWHNDPWANCDFDVFWRCHTNEYSGFHNTWNSNGALLSFRKSEIDTGKALYITPTSKQFSVSPNFLFKENGKDAYFHDVDLAWSDYDTLTFKVKSSSPLRFDGLRINANGTLWVMPAVSGTNETGFTVEGNGKVHTVTLDLNRLYPYGDINASAYTSDILSLIWGAEFIFTDINSNGAEVCFDDVCFGTTPVEGSTPTEPEVKLSFFEKIKAFFASLFAKISLFFENMFN